MLFICVRVDNTYCSTLQNESFPEDGKRPAASIVCLVLNVMTFLIFACILAQYGIDYLNLKLEDEIDDCDPIAGDFQVFKVWLKHEASELLNFQEWPNCSA